MKLTEEERAAAAAAEQAAEEAGSASDSDGDAPPGLAGIPGPPPEPGAPPPAAPAHAAENGEFSTAADDQAGGDKRRRRRSSRGKAKSGEGDSIILKDELAGPMRSAGPIRTAADMHRSVTFPHWPLAARHAGRSMHGLQSWIGLVLLWPTVYCNCSHPSALLSSDRVGHGKLIEVVEPVWLHPCMHLSDNGRQLVVGHMCQNWLASTLDGFARTMVK